MVIPLMRKSLCVGLRLNFVMVRKSCPSIGSTSVGIWSVKEEDNLHSIATNK
jgi:hypothetical protein